MVVLERIMDEHRIEKKANAGPSTQYLLLVSDDDRALFNIDQVLALYLIDVAERCKKSPPLQGTIEEHQTAETGNKGGLANKAASKVSTE